MDENWATDSIDIYIKFIQILKIAGNQFEFFWGGQGNDRLLSWVNQSEVSKIQKSLPWRRKRLFDEFLKIISNF